MLYAELAADVAELEQRGSILKRVVKLVTPTVVHIEAKRDIESARPARGEAEEAGSGVIIQRRGKFYVLTNRHVIKYSTLTGINIKLADGRVVHPTKTWGDPSTDVAIMSLTSDGLVPAQTIEEMKQAGFFKVLWSALTGPRAPGQDRWEAARQRFSDTEVDAARSVLPILSVFALIPVFWALFDQTFSTWVLQGEKMEPYLIGTYKVGPEQMLAINPLLVMLFVPIMTLWLYPLLGRLASPLRRMAYGMFLAALSFVIVAILQERLDAGVKLSVLWQIVPYIVLTMAEVFVSTTGLEFAFREAAASMKSTIMGFWNLTVALGNLLVSFITLIAAKVLTGGQAAAGEVSISPKMFYFYAGLTFVVAIAFSVIAAFYKYRDQAAAQGR